MIGAMRACEDLRFAELDGAMTYVDELHAVGMYGPCGGGIASATASRIASISGRHAGEGVRLPGGHIAETPI